MLVHYAGSGNEDSTRPQDSMPHRGGRGKRPSDEAEWEPTSNLDGREIGRDRNMDYLKEPKPGVCLYFGGYPYYLVIV